MTNSTAALPPFLQPALTQYLPRYSALADQNRWQHTFQDLTSRLAEQEQPSSHVVVIPAFNENTQFLRHWLSQSFTDVQQLLVLLVINQPDHLTIPSRLNRRLREFCASAYSARALVAPIWAAEPGLSRQEGVGGARKIGADFALGLMAEGLLKPGWLHTSDADATVSTDYFVAPDLAAGLSALIYPFAHRYPLQSLNGWQKTIAAASLAYETHLHYYRLGLCWAGSPYGFTPLGSCMAAHPAAYAQVRGFPRRAAGEDFYLLNKLAKLGSLYQHPSPVILKPRTSNRVPFGTGPAVAARLKGLAQDDYHPACFVQLKHWLDTLSHWYHQQAQAGRPDIAALDQACRLLDEPCLTALNHLGLQDLLSHLARQATNANQALRMTHEFFDGFKTLKWIHRLTHTHYPRLPITELMAHPHPLCDIFRPTTLPQQAL
jgi:hypothetical protein